MGGVIISTWEGLLSVDGMGDAQYKGEGDQYMEGVVYQ